MNQEIQQTTINFLRSNHPAVFNFWNKGDLTQFSAVTPQDHADYIYTSRLLGTLGNVNRSAVQRFAEFLDTAPLSGRKNHQERYIPHLSAYLFGAMNLLGSNGFSEERATVLSNISINIEELIDLKTKLPLWPSKWSHHSWRVSHWIGGIPSILLTLAKHQANSSVSLELVNQVLDACNTHIVNSKTGLLKAYKSQLLQNLFRTLYRLRHDPEHGDIGGIVHLLWINHALDRPYVANAALLQQASKGLTNVPFLEAQPYCLDFDYIQLIRTALDQNPSLKNEALITRLKQFNQDLTAFLSDIPKEGYTLHKLPGALATLHELAFLVKGEVEQIDVEPVDIIKEAYWL